MISLEKQKRLRAHLINAQKHAASACRFNDSRMAAREMKNAVDELAVAIELFSEILNRRPEIY